MGPETLGILSGLITGLLGSLLTFFLMRRKQADNVALRILRNFGRRIKNLESEHAACTQTNAQLREELGTLRAENTSLREDVQEMRIEKNELQEEVSELRLKLERLEGRQQFSDDDDGG